MSSFDSLYEVQQKFEDQIEVCLTVTEGMTRWQAHRVCAWVVDHYGDLDGKFNPKLLGAYVTAWREHDGYAHARLACPEIAPVASMNNQDPGDQWYRA
jgi:hypothetical protein